MAREPHRTSEILDAVALLVVDMQDSFLNVMPDREAVLRRTALAIECARAFGIKVIFTEQMPSKLGHTHADLLALAPDARVFAKAEFSALLAEGLQEYLRKINVYHLLLAGIETPICIYQTALHAQDQELDVTLLSDCTTGRRPDDCLVVLEALARAECHVLPAETVFYSMIGSSLNPRFPHFTRIVKRYSGEGPIDGSPTPVPDDERQQSDNRHDRRESDRPAGGRQDRSAGGRQGDRGPRQQRQSHAPQQQPHTRHHEEEPADSIEDTDDLRAEDGISDDEANQPSYEEMTADHSGDDMSPEGKHGDNVVPDDVPPAVERPTIAAGPDDSSESEDDTSDEPDSGAEGTPGDAAEKKKRPRRRRGGARRRRARERAATSGPDSSADNPAADAAPSDSASSAEGATAEGSAPAEGTAPTTN